MRTTVLLTCLLLSLASVGHADAPAAASASPSTWGISDVGEWLFEEGMGVHRATFAAHGIDGRALLAMREHALQECEIEKRASGLLVCSHPGAIVRCSRPALRALLTCTRGGVGDRAVLMDAIGRLRQGILDKPVDLWDWRAAKRHHHDTLLAGIVNCPRATILYLHHFEYKESLRPLFYRDGTGLGFWISWLLCPRVEIAYYLDEFKSTHPQLVQHMWITALGSTLTESCSWLLLIFCPERLPGNERGVDGDIVKMTLSKTLMTFGLWLVHPILSHDVQDACVYAMLVWPYIGILMGVFYVKGIVEAALGRCTRKGHEE